MNAELVEVQDKLGGRIILAKGMIGPCAKCSDQRHGGVGFICFGGANTAMKPCRGKQGKYTL